jgi:CSLREA domain-containing protein
MRKLYRMLIVVVMVMTPLTGRAQEIEGQGDPVSLHAAGRGNPWINLQDGRDLSAFYVGPVALTQALKEGRDQPLSLAAADFDEDGVPDLVSGYAGSSNGIMTLHRGNVDAIYPDTPAAQQRKAAGTFTDVPFLSPAHVFALPTAPDFLGTGDFDADGHQDVVAATRGGTALYLLPGDGQGGFDPARPIQLPGAVTALVVGEVNRRDGLADVVIGVRPFFPQSSFSPPLTGEGTREGLVLIFESPEGALRGEPETFAAPAEVTALALGQLDDHYAMDLAVAAGNELLIIHGRDRKLTLDATQQAAVPPATIDRAFFPFTIAGLAVGNFVWEERTYRPELALLAEDGIVHVLDPATSETITQHETSGKSSAHLVPARVSSLPTDDLLVIDSANHQLHVLMGDPTRQATEISSSVSLDVSGEPVAVLPMRLNRDALNDLVILKSGPNPLTVASTAPMQTFYVNSTGDDSDADTGDGTCATTAGECTLRAAIEQANASAGEDTITFNLGSGAQTIRPASALPDVTGAVVINGSTSPTTTVVLDGSNAGTDANGLSIVASGCTIRGMVINRFRRSGIENGFGIALFGNNNIVEGNYLGTDAAGASGLGNENGGVAIAAGASLNSIGGNTQSAHNVISGNGGHGVQIGEPDGGAASNTVTGNYIGLNPAGDAALANTYVGVLVGTNSTNNAIGGQGELGRNIISGNGSHGVGIQNGSVGTLVYGNYIGLNPTGDTDMPNDVHGVAIYNASNNNVGYTTEDDRNYIAGNGNAQVAIAHGEPLASSVQVKDTVLSATAHTVQVSAYALRREAQSRDRLDNASGVAPSTPFQGHEDSTGNQVQGNYIGVKVDNTASFFVTTPGVMIQNGSENTVGGAVYQAQNLISRNLVGVWILASDGYTATNNTVAGNRIGTDETGSVTDPDQVPLNGDEWGNYVGVIIENASENTIGGTTNLAKNVISGNFVYGVLITGTLATQNKVQGNCIGTDPLGHYGSTTALGNGLAGIFIGQASQNMIGGTQDSAANAIAFNGGDGVIVDGGTRNEIRRNLIHSNRELPIDLGNDGVTLGDPLDADQGANDLQNPPVITMYKDFVFTGTLHSKPNQTYEIDFFSYEINNSHKMLPGFGDGKGFSSSIPVQTNAQGDATFSFGPVLLSTGHSLAATATDSQGNTSEFSNTPFQLRSSTSTFFRPESLHNDHTQTVLLYTVPHSPQAEVLSTCATDLDVYIVVNGDTANPLKMENDGAGSSDASHADLSRADLHYSRWITPTENRPYTLTLHVAPKDAGFDQALLCARLRLDPIPMPSLIVLTDFRELFREFNLTSADSARNDTDGNHVLDYYDAVERIRQYADNHRGIVVDVRQDAYRQDYDYYHADVQTRINMGQDIDGIIKSFRSYISLWSPWHRAKAVAIIGDDAVVPFYRMIAPGEGWNRPDDHPAEVHYPGNLGGADGNITLSDTGIAAPQALYGYFMSDVPYGTYYDNLDCRFTDADMGVGRIFYDTPRELIQGIDAYEQPISLRAMDSRTAALYLANDPPDRRGGTVEFTTLFNDYIRGAIRGHYGITRVHELTATNQPAEFRDGNAYLYSGQLVIWTYETFRRAAENTDLLLVNSHATHTSWQSPAGRVGDFNPSISAQHLDSANIAVAASIGCHSGYSISYRQNNGDDYYRESLVRAMLNRHVVYLAPSIYDLAGLGERTQEIFVEALFSSYRSTIGDAYHAIFARYMPGSPDLPHDIYVLYSRTLYGLPTQEVRSRGGRQSVRTYHPTSNLPTPFLERAVDATAITATETFTLPHFAVSLDDTGRAVFDIPHQGGRAGAPFGPVLPEVRRNYLLPLETTDITVTIVQSQTHVHPTPVALQTVPLISRHFGPLTGTFTYTNPYPQSILSSRLISDVGGLNLSLSFFPLQYNPETRQVTLYDRLDYRIAYQPPTTVTVQGLTVNAGNPLSIGVVGIPVTLTLNSGLPITGNLIWAVEDGTGTTMSSDLFAVELPTGTTTLSWDLDAAHWTPGPMHLWVAIQDSDEKVVAGSWIDFIAEGEALAVTVERGAYSEQDTTAVVAVTVRDETGTGVSGCSDDLQLLLNGSPIESAWQEGADGLYTTTISLAELPVGGQMLVVKRQGVSTTSIELVENDSFIVDHGIPTSTLRLASTGATTMTLVSLGWRDDATGPSVITVEYRIDDGAWQLWRTFRLGYYPGERDFFGPTDPVPVDLTRHVYCFRSQAEDGVGHQEPEHAEPDVCTELLVPLANVTIAGPTHGVTGTAYVFTATVDPPTVTLPVYTWSPPPMPGSLILPGQSVVTYTWDALGTYAITVTAENCGGSATATHTIIIGTATDFIFLPLVLRGYEPLPVPDRYVKRYGDDSGDCSTPETACGSIQYAIDQADEGDLIAIAGYSDAYSYPGDPDGNPRWTYWYTESRPKPDGYYGPDNVSQVAYIDESITLRGGYSADFSTWDPDTYKTVLRPGLSGFGTRVVLVAPGASPTLEWLYVLEGDATYVGGAYNPFYDYQSAGGGIAAIGTFNGNDTITIRNCVVAGNIASTSYNACGGGIYLDYRNNSTLTDNTVYGNIATDVYGPPLGQGGGIAVSSSDNVVIRSNEIYSNVATTGSGRGEGAGLWAGLADNVQITSNEIYSNTGNDNGGGIHVRASGNIQMDDNVVHNNVGAQRQSGVGGGINLFWVEGALVQNNTIYSNTATTSSSSNDTGFGGGVYVIESEEIVVSNNVITGNVANLYHSQGTGGGLSFFNTPGVLVSQNLIRDNVSAPSDTGDSRWGGGGVRVSFRTDATLINNIIVRNQDPDGGDGIILIGNSDMPVAATLLHNTIADNGTSGGLTQQVSVPVVAPVVEGETPHDLADVAVDGPMDAESRLMSDIHSSVAVAQAEAQGILVDAYSILTGTNTIVSGHEIGVSVSYPASSTVTMDYTLWYSNTTSNYSSGVTDTNPRSGDPAFVDPAAWDYHIGSGSAAIDQGTNAGVTTDLDGDARPYGSGYDIGADEYTGAWASLAREHHRYAILSLIKSHIP